MLLAALTINILWVKKISPSEQMMEFQFEEGAVSIGETSNVAWADKKNLGFARVEQCEDICGENRLLRRRLFGFFVGAAGGGKDTICCDCGSGWFSSSTERAEDLTVESVFLSSSSSMGMRVGSGVGGAVDSLRARGLE